MNGIADLYKSAKQKGEDKSIDQKIANSNSLALIEETEDILLKYFEEFQFIEEKFPAEFSSTWKDIKTRKRTENQKKLMD